MVARILDPGQFSARLDLEMRSDTGDGQGGVVTAYAVTGSVWARIEPVAVEVGEVADEAGFAVTHRIWIRFRNDIGAGMRFRKGGRVFVIRAFSDPDETRRYLVCRCTEEGR
ncbi:MULTISPECIES: phage head closure protein [unclassified Rhizobium]|uniref:phage head closure protein n=1 Tax=unclassified Rhizobium TaxID=2613769 RepID=UPI000713E366|nr:MULTISPECIES: phage head closure protein [unclassified Rhizobium]KQS96488.1 head-tail adaptor protein [Rhizobium sp. Leaf386]KQT06327.1 head-tail adaptor protein [Rhizobium sp. Leaf391]KQT92397.1 head-tail adaptor protein [Rhizobium sp. Leaf453]